MNWILYDSETTYVVLSAAVYYTKQRLCLLQWHFVVCEVFPAKKYTCTVHRIQHLKKKNNYDHFIFTIHEK